MTLLGNRNVVIIGAAVMTVFLILNALDLGNQTYAGFSSDRSNTVIQVRPDSPAEQAGFAVGDRIVMNGGLAVTDSKALSRRARAEVGESRDFVIERDGEEQTLTLTYSGLPSRQMGLNIMGLLTGLAFLVFGLWPFAKGVDRTTSLLALVSISFALLWIGPPYFSSYALRTAVGVLFLPVLLLGFAALLHFVMSFPKDNPWLAKANAMKILYGPPMLLAAYIILLTLLQPDSTDTLNTVNSIIFGVFFLGYFGLTVFHMVKTYVRSDSEERSASGLNVMAIGVVLALLPLVISIAVNIVAPQVILPGSDYFGVTFVLMPLAFAYAVLKTRPARTAAA